MSSAQDPAKSPTTHETSQKKDSVAETIAYARQTYKGNQKGIETEPEKYFLAHVFTVANTDDQSNGFVKRFLNNVSHALQSNRYGGSGGV